MTVLPLPEPPAQDVAAVLEAVQTIRGHLADAERQTALLELGALDLGDWSSLGDLARAGDLRALWLGVELSAADHRAKLWSRLLDEFLERGRALGLQL